MGLDVISFVIRWPAFGDTRNRSIGQLVSVMNGERADEPIGDITKGDVVNSLVKVSAKTANRDLKALKMLFN
jgi:hypothetical protein